MGAFQYISVILPLLHAAQVHGWGGGGNWGHPQQPPDPYFTTVQVQATYTPTVVVVQTPPAVNTEPESPGPTQVVGSQSQAPGVGVSTGPAGATSAGTPQPSGSSSPNSCGSNVQKISLSNQSGKTLVVQAGPPWTVGQCGSIASGSTCTFCQQRGSTGGNLQFGYGTANSRGTWIEGNWDSDVQWATVDISFIPGYSVPISCTSDLTGATNGWGSPLCTDAECSNCNSGGGSWDGTACENPAGNANNPIPSGPCPSFFSSSAGGAYCFPNDNGVVGFGQPWSSVSCTAGAQYGGSYSKRDANDTLIPREEEQQRSPILEGRNPIRLSGHGGARVHARSLKNTLG